MAPRQAQGITRPTGRLINGWWSIRMGKWGALSFQGFQVMTPGHDLICPLSLLLSLPLWQTHALGVFLFLFARFPHHDLGTHGLSVFSLHLNSKINQDFV